MKSSTLVSHVFATGAGIYGGHFCTSGTLILPTIAYGLVTFHNAMGIVKYFVEDDNNIEDVYKFSRFLQLIFPFPCFVGALWLHHGAAKKEVAYIHPAVSLIPLISKCLDKDLHDKEQINTILVLNTISGLYVTIVNENWMGVATVIACAITFGAVQLKGGRNNREQEEGDEFNIAVGISTIISYFGLGFHTLKL